MGFGQASDGNRQGTCLSIASWIAATAIALVLFASAVGADLAAASSGVPSAVPGVAQETAPATQTGQTGAAPTDANAIAAAAASTSGPAIAVPANYQLGAGDVIQVVVWGQPDLSGLFRVAPDGALTLPLVGPVPVAGLTLAQATARITQALGEYLKKPQATLALQAPRQLVVQALGAVAHPGTYTLPANASVLDLLAAAGGPAPDADLDAALIKRLGQPRQPIDRVDLHQLATAAGLPATAQLHPGDLLYVPSAAVKVAVVGQVQRPGLYTLPTGGNLIDAIAAAGGLLPGADQQQIEVHRLGQAAPEVGTSRGTVTTEAVGTAEPTPATGSLHLPLPGPPTLNTAGSAATTSAPEVAGDVASNGRTFGDRNSLLTLDSSTATFRGALSQNPPLVSGDVIVVPDRHGVDYQKVLNVLSGLNILKNLFSW